MGTCRLLAVRAERRSWYLMQSGLIHNYPIVTHHGTPAKVGHNSSLCRIFSPLKVSNTVRGNSWKSNHAKNFCALANNSSLTTHYAQVPWKGHNLIHLLCNPIFLPLRRLYQWKGNDAKNFHALSKNSYSTFFSAQLAHQFPPSFMLRPYLFTNK